MSLNGNEKVVGREAKKQGRGLGNCVQGRGQARAGEEHPGSRHSTRAERAGGLGWVTRLWRGSEKSHGRPRAEVRAMLPAKPELQIPDLRFQIAAS